MTLEEQHLKTSLHKAIVEWSKNESEGKNTSNYDSLGVFVHPGFESDMTDAAWAVFSAMAKSQAYLKDN